MAQVNCSESVSVPKIINCVLLGDFRPGIIEVNRIMDRFS